MDTTIQNSGSPTAPPKPKRGRPRGRRKKALPKPTRDGWVLVDPDAEAETGLDVPLPRDEARIQRARNRIAQFLTIKAVNPSITIKEAAAQIGVVYRTLNRDLALARQHKWLQFEDQLTRMEHEIVPKVVDNLNHFLDIRDKAVTIEAAKGTIFKTYQNAKGISDAPQTVLALRIEQPTGDERPIVTGHIVGAPRVISSTDE